MSLKIGLPVYASACRATYMWIFLDLMKAWH